MQSPTALGPGRPLGRRLSRCQQRPAGGRSGRSSFPPSCCSLPFACWPPPGVKKWPHGYRTQRSHRPLFSGSPWLPTTLSSSQGSEGVKAPGCLWLRLGSLPCLVSSTLRWPALRRFRQALPFCWRTWRSAPRLVQRALRHRRGSASRHWLPRQLGVGSWIRLQELREPRSCSVPGVPQGRGLRCSFMPRSFSSSFR